MVQGPPRRQPNLLYPGLIVIVLLAIARFLGATQFFELRVFDTFLRWRPAEPVDERITIVEVSDEDIENIGSYPIPDTAVVEALTTIQQYDPRAIGFDIFRNFPVYGQPSASGTVAMGGFQQLVEHIQTNDNIVVIEKIVPPTISPPPDIPPEQVGFADAKLDASGLVRRSLLGSPDVAGNFRLSFTILLAQRYLEQAGFTLTNGKRDPLAMRFGEVELASAPSKARGYINSDAGGNPIVLINFRAGATPFQTVSLSDVLADKVPAEWLRDRVVLIGMTATGAKDFVGSDAVVGSNSGLISGITLQAHAISQILSAVLDDRPILKTWPPLVEYLWIVAWGLAGIGLSRLIRAPLLHLAVVILSGAGIFLVGYGLLLLGWWIPVVPAGLAYFFNGAILYGFYWYRQGLKLQIEERQRVIRQSYSAIHNGPLQTLALLLKMQHEDEVPPQKARESLTRLDRELRSVYETMERGALNPAYQLYLTGNFAVDLKAPLHEVLYQVYSHTVTRSLPYLSKIAFHITTFEPMTEGALTLEQKQEVARFFEEALCNVGRYAEGATRLKISCQQADGQNSIRVEDNGQGIVAKESLDPAQGGRGTRQAISIAKSLAGTFTRQPAQRRGTVCELCWPIRPLRPWQFWRWRLPKSARQLTDRVKPSFLQR